MTGQALTSAADTTERQATATTASTAKFYNKKKKIPFRRFIGHQIDIGGLADSQLVFKLSIKVEEDSSYPWFRHIGIYFACFFFYFACFFYPSFIFHRKKNCVSFCTTTANIKKRSWSVHARWPVPFSKISPVQDPVSFVGPHCSERSEMIGPRQCRPPWWHKKN